MDENQTTWHLLDWIVSGTVAVMGFFIKSTRDDHKELSARHDELKDTIHKEYTQKNDFTRALDNMDKNFELINKKLDLLFIPKSDK